MEKQSLDQTIAIFGCGWLGLPLGAKLVASGYTVVGTTTRAERLSILQQHGIEPCVFKLGDTELDSRLCETDIVIVCIPSKDIDGFEILAKEFLQSNIKKVLFVSSTSVYPSTDGVVQEDNVISDNALIEIENVFKRSKTNRTIIVRFSGLMGPKRHPGNFFANKSIPKPNGVVNFIHQDDCIGIIRAIVTQAIWGETFHAAADTHPSRREFYSSAKSLLNLPHPTFLESEDKGIGKIVTNQRIKERLGYAFIHPDVIESLETFK
jgi:nucleoside-diphosphate-sugar epimerase